MTIIVPPDACRKFYSGKLQDYRDFIVFKKVRFQNVLRPHEDKKPAFSNCSGLKSVFEKLRFNGGLVWTIGVTVLRNKAPAWCARGLLIGQYSFIIPTTKIIEMLALRD